MESKNRDTLTEFVLFCEKHPEFRFWQALRNWAGVRFIFVRTTGDRMEGDLVDTFYKDGRNDLVAETPAP